LSAKPRLAYIVTHPITANLLLRGQLRFMRERGFDVTVIASPGPELDAVRDREGVHTIGVRMSRSVRPDEGPRAAWGMLNALKEARPDIVNASTAKAGLLGLLASRALAIPARIYLLRGLRLEGFAGLPRSLLGAAEHVSVACAHHVVSVSESLRRAYIEARYAPAEKISVIPSNGIDVSRFIERSRTREQAAAVRARLRISREAKVVGFVGRLVADKGAADIIAAFEDAATVVPELHLLVVGGDLAGDALPGELLDRFRKNPRVTLAGTVDDPSPYYAAMDLLLFPSYREGLPNVPLEAAACELAAIGYRSTGIIDAISDGETGQIVERGDGKALAAAVVRYCQSPELRALHGRAGRKRVLKRFTNELTWDAWAQLYDRLLPRS
jgi:glycosyltransferase involved in cell wall biosynthesis